MFFPFFFLIHKIYEHACVCLYIKWRKKNPAPIKNRKILNSTYTNKLQISLILSEFREEKNVIILQKSRKFSEISKENFLSEIRSIISVLIVLSTRF